MKPMTKMSEEELNDLVAYQVGTLHVYYDKVSTVSDTTFIYNGDRVTEVSPKHIEGIRQGKLTYEAYKLQSASMNVDDYIRSHAVDILTGTLEDVLTATQEQITSLATNMESSTNDVHRKLLNISATATSLKPITDTISVKTRALDSTLSSIDLDKLHSKIESVSEIITPAIERFDDVTDKLQSLFK